MTRRLSSYTAGSDVEIGTFDIADISLSAPADGITTTLPVTFTWQLRAATLADSYEVNLYGADYDPWWWTEPALGYTSTYSLPGLPLSAVSETLFAAEQAYNWEVWVYAPDGASGVSLDSRSLVFTAP
jgi:hypothetical protein